MRAPDQLTWDVDYIVPYLEQAEKNGWTVVKVHSHPGGHEYFSDVDDIGDKRLLPAIQAWIDGDFCHGSAIMLPDGRLFGRYITTQEELRPYHKIAVVGDDIVYWTADTSHTDSDFAESHRQLFGDETFRLLHALSVAVVGCSGTGSPVIEQLARLGIGELILVDSDVVETQNLNRILNATINDADEKRFKVDVLTDAVRNMGLGTQVRKLNANLWNRDVVQAVAESDVVFGCMDTVDGRYLLNTLATYYCIPYIDVGVRIDASTRDENYGEILEVCGSVHYLKPGHSLMSRNVFTMQAVSEAGLARTDPKAYSRNVQDGYVRGIAVNRPAVISLNMTIASLAVNELLARLHPFRDDSNAHYDHIEVSLTSMAMFADPKPQLCSILSSKIGLGDCEPLLGIPELSIRVGANGHY